MTAKQLDATTKADPVDDRATSLLAYWYRGSPDASGDATALMQHWFGGSPELDEEIRLRFGDLAADAARGELDDWTATPRGRLALILLLDQLPRNLYRGTKAAFAQDAKALRLCLEGMRGGGAGDLHPLEQMFLLMPLQHAESRAMQARGAEAFAALAAANTSAPFSAALTSSASYAREHRDIVDRFGRFPHRNKLLGRESTPAEIEFLAAGGSSFGQ